MSYSINFSSGVYYQEIDNSLRVQGPSTSIGGAVLHVNKGRVGLDVVYDGDSYLEKYGDLDPRVSLAPYALLEALRELDRIYLYRVVDGALCAGMVLSDKTANKLSPPTVSLTSATTGGTLAPATYGYRVSATDEYGESLAQTVQTTVVAGGPTTASLTTALTGSNNDLKFTAVNSGTVGNSNSITYTDPGANNAALSVTITPNTGYAVVNISLATDGGGAITTTANDILTLLAAQGTAFSAFMSVELASGNTGAGVVIALATTSLSGGAATGGSTSAVTVNWTAVTGAEGYKVYGRTSGSELLIATITSGSTLSYVDTGAVTPAGALPGINTTGEVRLTPFSLGLEDPANEYAWQSGDKMIIYADNPGEWANGLSLSISKLNTTDSTFEISVFLSGQTTAIEKWTVSLVDNLDGFGKQLFAEERINPLSRRIKVLVNPDNTTALDQRARVKRAMAGGDNGSAVSDNEIANAWSNFEDPEEVPVRLLINAGYASPEVHLAMDNIARGRTDCVALLDVPSDQQEASLAINYRNLTLNLDSSWSALYTCDQLLVDPQNDRQIWVPPSGFVARAFGYTDRNYAPWFAVAGMDRGNVQSLQSRWRYSKQGERDSLAEAQVNYIRTFLGQGKKIWEQFTCTGRESALQYLNVRMLLIYINLAIKEYLLYNVFDPNDEITRSRIRSRIRQFLDRIIAGRGLYAHYVTTPVSTQDIDEGTLPVKVELEPVIPARRIILILQVNRTGATLKEATIAGNQLA